MGGSNSQQKSAYNQARSMQNWEMQQYQDMTAPGGSLQTNQTNALNALTSGEKAAQTQTAGTNAGIYGGLQDYLQRSQARQGGYMSGFGADQASLARQQADTANQATAGIQEQFAPQIAGQYNTNISQQLQALGLTESQIQAMIGTQGNIANNISSPVQTALGWADVAATPIQG